MADQQMQKIHCRARIKAVSLQRSALKAPILVLSLLTPIHEVAQQQQCSSSSSSSTSLQQPKEQTEFAMCTCTGAKSQGDAYVLLSQMLDADQPVAVS